MVGGSAVNGASSSGGDLCGGSYDFSDRKSSRLPPQAPLTPISTPPAARDPGI